MDGHFETDRFLGNMDGQLPGVVQLPCDENQNAALHDFGKSRRQNYFQDERKNQYHRRMSGDSQDDQHLQYLATAVHSYVEMQHLLQDMVSLGVGGVDVECSYFVVERF